MWLAPNGIPVTYWDHDRCHTDSSNSSVMSSIEMTWFHVWHDSMCDMTLRVKLSLVDMTWRDDMTVTRRYLLGSQDCYILCHVMWDDMMTWLWRDSITHRDEAVTRRNDVTWRHDCHTSLWRDMMTWQWHDSTWRDMTHSHVHVTAQVICSMCNMTRSYVTHTDESRHICEWVTSHVELSHVADVRESRHKNESCHTQRWVTAHMWMGHVTSKIELCHGCEWVMSYEWDMSHVTSHEPLRTYNWVTSRMWMSNVIWMSHDTSHMRVSYVIWMNHVIWMRHVT